jgi:hypothetical protein
MRQLCSIYKSFVRMVHTRFSTPIRVFFALTLVVSICPMLFDNFCPQRVLLLSSLVLVLMLRIVLLNENIAIL